MKSFAACVVSAVLGAVIALALADRGIGVPVFGQAAGERRPVLSVDVPPEDAEAVSLLPPEEAYGRDGLTIEEAVGVYVYDRVNRSVVNITTRTRRVEGLIPIESTSEENGSGTILDESGHVLTNFHVVENAQQVSATLFDGKSYDATFVGGDPINDVAVIRIDAPPDVLFPATLGDSKGLRVGMSVYAIGNPFGLERTMTTGIVSSLNRSLQVRGNRTIKSIIQCDAAINPGNSGGPLLDARGEVIGMNTAIASSTGQNSGIGFAIPINLVKRVVPELIEHGRVIRPDIGIQRVYETGSGLLIAKLTPDGAAEAAGLRGPRITRERRGPFVVERVDRSAGDLIVAVEGEPVETADEFLEKVESHRPGDRIVLSVIRDGQRLELAVVLGG